MDPEAFLDLANQVAKLKMYPYFELAHAAVCCLVIKEDMGSGKRINGSPYLRSGNFIIANLQIFNILQITLSKII